MVQMLMVDVNSYHAPSDLLAHYKAGRRVIGVKVTEGVDYVWQRGLQIIDEWHRLGPDAHAVPYHFATAGHSGATQADHYLAAVRSHLRWADKFCIDVEGQPGSYRQWAHGEAKAVHDAFIDRANAAGPRYGRLKLKRLSGLTYGGPYFLRDSGIRKRGGWRLWIAAYVDRLPFIPPGWWTWMAWQNTDRAMHVPGVPGPVDQSVIKKWMLS